MTTDTTHITKDQSEARKAEVPETEALKPCPFCGGKCDPEGWIGDKKRSGPACDDCGSAAETVAIWNTRAAELELQAPLTSREQDAHDAKILAGPSFFTPEAISRQQAQPNNGMTHWEGCWREHHECAMAIIERSQAQPVAKQEPVAWRRKHEGDDYWCYQEKKSTCLKCINEPLYTAPAQAQPPADELSAQDASPKDAPPLAYTYCSCCNERIPAPAKWLLGYQLCNPCYAAWKVSGSGVSITVTACHENPKLWNRPPK